MSNQGYIVLNKYGEPHYHLGNFIFVPGGKSFSFEARSNLYTTEDNLPVFSEESLFSFLKSCVTDDVFDKMTNNLKSGNNQVITWNGAKTSYLAIPVAEKDLSKNLVFKKISQITKIIPLDELNTLSPEKLDEMFSTVKRLLLKNKSENNYFHKDDVDLIAQQVINFFKSQKCMNRPVEITNEEFLKESIFTLNSNNYLFFQLSQFVPVRIETIFDFDKSADLKDFKVKLFKEDLNKMNSREDTEVELKLNKNIQILKI